MSADSIGAALELVACRLLFFFSLGTNISIALELNRGMSATCSTVAVIGMRWFNKKLHPGLYWLIQQRDSDHETQEVTHEILKIDEKDRNHKGGINSDK